MYDKLENICEWFAIMLGCALLIFGIPFVATAFVVIALAVLNVSMKIRVIVAAAIFIPLAIIFINEFRSELRKINSYE